MKIMICGSMSFSPEMIAAKKQLAEMGHEVQLPCDVDVHLANSGFIDDLDADLAHCRAKNILKIGFDDIAASDAAVFLNYPKNGVAGYVGTSSLMEMAIAYYLGKKIFLLHPVPPSAVARWAHEVRIIDPVVIDGDLSKIKI